MKPWFKNVLAGAVATLIAAPLLATVFYQFSPGGALGGTSTSQTVNLNSGGAFILNQLPASAGGLGANCAATNGFVPIGNGTTFPCAALTAGAGITVTPGAGSNTIASTGTGWVYKVVTVTNDNRSSTTSPTNDTNIVYTSLAAGHYLVYCDLTFSSTTATGTFPGARWNWSTTTNGTYISRSYVAPALSGIFNFVSGFPGSFLGSATINQLAGGANAAFMTGREYLLFSTTGTGTLNLGWAQNTSSANTTTLVKGSYCKLLKVS